MKASIVLFSISIFFISCKSDSQMSQDAMEHISNAGNSLKELINKAETPEELKKLNRFEYKILSFNDRISYPAMEERLNELGLSGWDCTPSAFSNIQTETKETQFFCKKRPETFLKYLKQIY